MLEMSIIDNLADFSRNHCVAICATLIPLIFLFTFRTLLLGYWQRTMAALLTSATIATGLVVALFFHVSTWFIVGVVHPVTFILAILGSICLVVNWIAVGWRQWRSPHDPKPTQPLNPVQG